MGVKRVVQRTVVVIADHLSVAKVAADSSFTQGRMYAEAFVCNALGIYCPAELWSTGW